MQATPPSPHGSRLPAESLAPPQARFSVRPALAVAKVDFAKVHLGNGHGRAHARRHRARAGTGGGQRAPRDLWRDGAAVARQSVFCRGRRRARTSPLSGKVLRSNPRGGRARARTSPLVGKILRPNGPNGPSPAQNLSSLRRDSRPRDRWARLAWRPTFREAARGLGAWRETGPRPAALGGPGPGGGPPRQGGAMHLHPHGLTPRAGRQEPPPRRRYRSSGSPPSGTTCR